MRVANFVAPTSGGIRSVIRRLSAAAAERGIESHVVVPGPDPGIAPMPGMHVHALQGVRLHPRQPYRLILQRSAVRRLLDEVRPDVIEIHDQLSLAWLGAEAAQRGIPSVLIAHERLDELARFWSGLHPAGCAAERWITRIAGNVTQVVAPSEFAAKPYRRSGVPVAVVPWGVDHTTFRPAELTRDRHRLQIVHCGRLSAEKDPLLSAKAASLLARQGIDASITVIGSGPVESRFAEFDPSVVSMAGFVGGPDVLAEKLRSADVFFAPGPFETFGVSALEAMACGLPVVCRESGSISEIPATTPAAGTPEAFADAALRLWADPQARSRSSVSARGYTWPRAAAAIEEVYAA
ncbi:glycosyltransferase [Epidermidibacterium keratini]|uniref:Glycosyltransferase n=1 Tax=Epidermidibacterium keratini TaxID=1891644 RepID=A0A7L4YPT2_9ACTN|nr:glycosyltransferase [Epidermidibacterium keratini]QHC01032.1 glycosyltransferase [Epidermidibacterium keratini]